MFSCLRRWGAGSGYERVPAGPEAQKCNPEKNASFFSRMTYSWFSRVIVLGYKKPLEREDLCELHESDSSYIVCPIFEKQWRKEVLRTQERQEAKASFSKETHARKPSLVYALWNTFKFVLIQVAVFKVFADILSFTSPLIMKQMIVFCEHHPDFGWSGYGYALALFVVVFLQTLILQQYQRFNMLTSAKIKTAVIGLLYKKALLLSNVSRKKFSTGEITNLMSADAQQLMDLTANLSLLWSAPFQILMAISLLWQELGPAVLAGVAVLVFVIPVNALVATRVKKLKKSQTKNKDKQIKLLNEILHGIKILKLYAWESSYQKKIIKIREQELEVQKSAGYLAVFSMLTLTCIPFLVSLATFGIYFLLDEGNILTATKVFTSMSLFNILRLPLFDLPMVISAVVQTRVSLDRLEDFLNTEELHPQNIETNYIGDHAIGFTNASFSWDKTGVPVLKNLNIKIPEGALVAVVGPVGSGKSSVLSAILGEMEKLTGVVQRKGSVAYVAQQAWIQNCILQENILFGSIMQKQFYERVLEACALLPDLEQLPNGDQTEIGERGVNISGGQKHRVSLARAVYSGADIYLLDDPFAAVDVHVGKQLFEKVIGSSGILKNKTRILVTHNLTLLPEMDLIVVMESGRVAHMGTYHELLSKTRNLTNLLQAFSEQEKAHALKRVSVINSRTILKDQIVEQNDRPSLNQGKQFSMKKEKIPVGGVKFSIILKYLQAFGWLWVWLSVAAYLGQNLVGVAQNLWLSAWVKEARHMNEFTEWKQIRSNKLNIYGLLGLMQGFFVCSGAYILTRGSLAASRTLHTQLLDNVLHLPLRFFEINPIGQIINRFTKDMFIIDIRFHYYLRNWVNCTLDVIGTVLVIGGALPLFILGVIPLMFLYLTIQITQSLNFWVRKACEIETNAVSIERVCEYENMDKEIGIVGRTGAGKSTLSNCLFRIVERSGGKIIIDGIDISTIGLHDLRGRLNIIPQDPVLFSGTLQMNLDPLDKYSDRELWEVLELCHLKDFVQSLPKKLLHEISEGGENLSVGQRQLVCLARALLRKTKILILDEATASIDFETDTLVQTTIRKEFSDCTVLTIAHRLHSIIDSDRVLVLDSGRITEFETPQNLICQKGLFFEMLTEAGITQDSVTK
ncbi:multidrug resistance-associated protein 1-like isoform X6 [Mustela lutreola]|uniref:multidrug resistance-associated protein 1-like isoform X6 n=1 Tax=Mustela lutreola TaxID=9666 RepID=UPI0027970F61|nr:multidrug resistance-associated protein 1-like isoform X6 [Mustela lutreola]